MAGLFFASRDTSMGGTGSRPSAASALIEFIDLRDQAQVSELEAQFETNQVATYLTRELIDPRRGPYRAVTAVIEKEYIDRDFNSAYITFYARAFRDSGRNVKRIHFFRTEVDREQFRQDSGLQSAYLGFFTLYPGPVPRVGRSVLTPVAKDVDAVYVPCQGKFPVNILGAQLHASGVPFIEQDGRVAACASAAIWMAANAIPRVTDESGDRIYADEGIRSTSLAEITRAATEFTLDIYGDPLLAPGLTGEQILLALRELGFLPVLLRPDSPGDTRNTIYSYVESQIPVILAIACPHEGGSHAVTVVGHTFDPRRSLPTVPPTSMNSSYWCPRFIFNDDQHGPYHQFEIGDLTPATEERPSFRVIVDDVANGAFEGIEDFFSDAYLNYMIVPMPPRVFLLADDAQQIGKTLIEVAHLRHRVPMPATPAYRTYLTRSNSFKHRLQTDAVSGLPQSLADFYREVHMSRYVWVVEMTDAQTRYGTEPEDLRLVAEAVLDATASPDVLDFICLRIPGRVMHRLDGQSTRDAILAATRISTGGGFRPAARIPAIRVGDL